MQHKCKITVLETKVFPNLHEKYLTDPKSGPCPFFHTGNTFVLKRTPEQDDFYHLMNGKFCGEAWNAVSRYLVSGAETGATATVAPVSKQSYFRQHSFHLVNHLPVSSSSLCIKCDHYSHFATLPLFLKTCNIKADLFLLICPHFIYTS